MLSFIESISHKKDFRTKTPIMNMKEENILKENKLTNYQYYKAKTKNKNYGKLRIFMRKSVFNKINRYWYLVFWCSSKMNNCIDT